ncbi:hypothetical protein EJB05_26310, partial [Eragrostis curvula]
MAGADRLSALPDEVLRRVLYFAPAKEGASTAVLSRRWRSLWRTSGAVNLSSCFYHNYFSNSDASAISDAFFRGAAAALAAAHAGGPVRRFTLHMEAYSSYYITQVLTRERIQAVLSEPVVKHIEELRIGAAEIQTPDTYWRHTRLYGYDTAEMYKLSFGDLPSEALRVLHIVNCRHLEPPPSGVTFPRLAHLRLQGCIISLLGLQQVMDAAPQLATLHLESFSFPRYHLGGSDIGLSSSCYHLLCPTVNTLVLEDCNWAELKGGLELEAPKLQYFVYKGLAPHCHRLSLKPHACTNLVQVDLHLTVETYEPICIPFWKFLQNFNTTKVLKLKLDFTIDLIAVADEKGQDELLGNNLFFHLEHLELEGQYYELGCETGAVALANILHWCPVARNLHLKLKQMSRTSSYLSSTEVAQLDFDKSIDHFRLRKRSMISMSGDYYDYKKCDVSDVPILNKHSFSCLQSHLRRVSLKFWMEHKNCFGIKLVKFFADNAMVLEEMFIDDGSQKMCHHVNR